MSVVHSPSALIIFTIESISATQLLQSLNFIYFDTIQIGLYKIPNDVIRLSSLCYFILNRFYCALKTKY